MTAGQVKLRNGAPVIIENGLKNAGKAVGHNNIIKNNKAGGGKNKSKGNSK